MNEQQKPDAKPAAPAEWRSPTMLSPEEIESLREDARLSMLKMRAYRAQLLAQRGDTAPEGQQAADRQPQPPEKT